MGQIAALAEWACSQGPLDAVIFTRQCV
jgi:hypothetical protein